MPPSSNEPNMIRGEKARAGGGFYTRAVLWALSQLPKARRAGQTVHTSALPARRRRTHDRDRRNLHPFKAHVARVMAARDAPRCTTRRCGPALARRQRRPWTRTACQAPTRRQSWPTVLRRMWQRWWRRPTGATVRDAPTCKHARESSSGYGCEHQLLTLHPDHRRGLCHHLSRQPPLPSRRP